jgi:hypothetical protein
MMSSKGGANRGDAPAAIGGWIHMWLHHLLLSSQKLIHENVILINHTGKTPCIFRQVLSLLVY